MSKVLITEKVKKALERIKEKVDGGDTIEVARRKIVGTPTDKFAREVMQTQEYVSILNSYMEKVEQAFIEKGINVNIKANVNYEFVF